MQKFPYLFFAEKLIFPFFCNAFTISLLLFVLFSEILISTLQPKILWVGKLYVLVYFWDYYNFSHTRSLTLPFPISTLRKGLQLFFAMRKKNFNFWFVDFGLDYHFRNKLHLILILISKCYDIILFFKTSNEFLLIHIDNLQQKIHFLWIFYFYSSSRIVEWY